ncbi:hypothetical protein HK405_012795 [Cladochytrium tenue]|nr:hypothetical protein HK405_012795 [Cladochytrium tenue]
MAVAVAAFVAWLLLAAAAVGSRASAQTDSVSDTAVTTTAATITSDPNIAASTASSSSSSSSSTSSDTSSSTGGVPQACSDAVSTLAVEILGCAPAGLFSSTVASSDMATFYSCICAKPDLISGIQTIFDTCPASYIQTTRQSGTSPLAKLSIGQLNSICAADGYTFTASLTNIPSWATAAAVTTTSSSSSTSDAAGGLSPMIASAAAGLLLVLTVPHALTAAMIYSSAV